MTRAIAIGATCLVLAAGGWAAAQGLAGTYEARDVPGVVLRLEWDAAGGVVGSLTGPDGTLPLEGEVDPAAPGVAYGTVSTPEGTLAFEATTADDGLVLTLVAMTPDGRLDPTDAAELAFVRAGGAAAAAAPPAPAGAANPLAPAPAANPLAAPDPFVGTFTDGALTLQLRAAGGRYEGSLELGGTRYPAEAARADGGLAGTFHSGADAFAFELAPVGEELVLSSGGATYTLRRADAAPAAAAAPAPGAVLARGAHAELSQDDALAFVEAFEFSLQQAGYVGAFTDAEREQLLAAIAQAFPTATAEEQLVLAQARQIWTETRQGWATASEADRRAFVLAVFTLAFGEEAVRASAGASAGDGGCTDFDACAGRYMDGETYLDAQNAQSCWASAGCGGYDAGSDTFYDTSGQEY